ncbi:hypothetical protein [Lactobacillus agrestimuris]|uniref:hypothetical protein n=1 Tax=Lactobacillus agrestimuris TaxID=2941328 RepID=UPI0019BB23AB|nr:hypothetical protein [Lactobacillus agrestimuris]MBD5431416.1 hypothetical protein [Lactobacillus sp.]
MTFASILILVLIAAILLSLLFVFFHIFIYLIPVALIAALIIWLIGKFSKNKTKDNILSSRINFEDFSNSGPKSNSRKRARNVKVKDVDDKK